MSSAGLPGPGSEPVNGQQPPGGLRSYFATARQFSRNAELTLCGLVVGMGFGLATRFFNVFFDLALGASDRQISAIFAVGALAGATSILFSGMFVRKWGKTRSIVVTQLASAPFLMMMVLVPLAVPGLPIVVVFLLLRDACYSISMPARDQLAMDLTVAQERGTAAGLTHMSFDLGGAFGAGISGTLIGVSAAEAGKGLVDIGQFVPAFVVAASLVVAAAGLYQVFFQGREARVIHPAVAAPEAG